MATIQSTSSENDTKSIDGTSELCEDKFFLSMKLHGLSASICTVNATDADLVFRSSDNIVFHIHSKNLQITAGGFPPAEFSPNNEVIDLPEKAAILELMFQFVYPRPQPALQKLDFDTLASLAEAVEKYQVYSARQSCNMMMGKVLPDHALEVLEYSFRHDYSELSDQAAPAVALVTVAERAKYLPPDLVQAWLRYHSMWNRQISDIMPFFKHAHSYCPGGAQGLKHYLMDIFDGILKVQGIPTDQSLTKILTLPSNSASCCRDAMSDVRVKLITHIHSLPLFTQLLTEPPPRVWTKSEREWGPRWEK